MNYLKELIYRIRGEYTTEKLIKMGMRVGENFTRLNDVILDPAHCWLIEIGNNVTMAPRVHVLCHDASTKQFIGYTKIGGVKVGNNVFVGADTVILPNDGYKMRFYNDIVWIYEYRSDGLTKAGNSLFLNNPRGYGLWLKEKALFMNFSLIKRIKMYYTFSCDLIGKYSTKVIAECIGAPVVMIRALISIHTLGALIRRKR